MENGKNKTENTNKTMETLKPVPFPRTFIIHIEREGNKKGRITP